MKSNQLISIIIPVYNTEKYLPRCIDSILNNSCKELEIICINDGSTDNSGSIIQEYQKSDDRIVIINILNGGISNARNIGLDYARGDYIAFIDSDDWIHSKYFEILLSTIIHYHADWAMVEVETTDAFCYDDTIIERLFVSECAKIRELFVQKKGSLTNLQRVNVCWACLFQRELIKNTRFDVNAICGEDTLFVHDIVANNLNNLYVWNSCKMYYYFQRSESIIHNRKYWDLEGMIEHFLISCKNSSENYAAMQLLKKAYTYALLNRYTMKLVGDKKRYKKSIEYINDCKKINKEKKLLSRKLSLINKVFSLFPVTYRLFRIATDKSMLDWEKRLKKTNIQ